MVELTRSKSPRERPWPLSEAIRRRAEFLLWLLEQTPLGPQAEAVGRPA
jgi:hypothetical protein